MTIQNSLRTNGVGGIVLHDSTGTKETPSRLERCVVYNNRVRTLALGCLPAGMYQSRNREAYWDGKNELGESVASGVYFYTLTAGDFTTTRKMLIRK